jgi:hypothetical protein
MHLKKFESLGSSNEGSIRFICSIIFGVNIGILVYDKMNHTTYLFQIKEGLDHHTRVACAQIRNASELLWHDFVRGQRTHIELYWENAVYSKTAETPYRYILKRKLREMGKDKFMKMFDDDAKIVFEKCMNFLYL